ncbi:MAG: peptidylprolyl isomerase [Alphaproteobacteria bacterium]|nr:peptidylprolyl isomerase [Alphaproteobacteria bacterium]
MKTGRLRRLCLALTVPGLLFLIDPAPAQELQRIAAVVNDDIVSMRDLRSRVRMVIVTSRLPATPETANRLAPQILRGLIDEQLQFQEAKRQGQTVNEEEMQRARGDVEIRNGLKPGEFQAFVRRLGVDPSTVEQQLQASLLWAKLVRRRFGNDVAISEDEVQESLDRLRADEGKIQKRVSEILLPVDNPGEEADVQRLAGRLVEQLRAGARFGDVARQFSRAANASVGGDIGWVLPERLAPEIAAAIEALDVGQISEPIRTLFGYHIIRVADTNVLAGPDPMAERVTLKQIFLPVPPSAGDEGRAAQRSLAEAVAATAQDCADIDVLAEEVKSPVSPNLGEFSIGELAPALRGPVADLKTGDASAPIDLPNGVMVVMVCDRQAAPSNLPTAEAIRRQLESQRYEILAQRYLRDLRQNAFVEPRV